MGGGERESGTLPEVEPKKPRNKSVKNPKTALSKRTYIVQKRGFAKCTRLRIRAVGFPKGKGNGMKFYYNFIFERALSRDGLLTAI